MTLGKEAAAGAKQKFIRPEIQIKIQQLLIKLGQRPASSGWPDDAIDFPQVQTSLPQKQALH